MLRYTMCLLFSLIFINLIGAPLWNNPSAIRQGVNLEWSRYGAETPDGCVIYVWSDTKRGDRDIYAQKVNSAGQMMWGEPVLVVGTSGNQSDPVITRTSDANYIVAWIDYSTGDQQGDIYARKINANGVVCWPLAGNIICNAPGYQAKLNIEPDAAGGAYIIWEDSRNASIDLFGQHINYIGEVQWSYQGIALSSAPGDEKNHTMWADGQGGIIIGYEYESQGTIYAKRVAPDGNLTWSIPLYQPVCNFYDRNVKMAPLNDSSFIFTWDRWNGNRDIYAQRVSLTGQTMWAQPIAVYSDSNPEYISLQEKPRIVKTSDNCVIIAWEDYRNDADDQDLYAQKIDPEGNKLWSINGVPITVSDFAQYDIRLASDNNGGCFASWTDHRNGNSPNQDIYAQHLSSSGESLWTANGVSISSLPGQQYGTHIRFVSNCIYIAWQDYGSGSSELKYQVLSPVGVNQLEQDGKLIFGGISGNISFYDYKILPRSNGSASLWVDERKGDHGYQIYIQLVNSDGSLILEPNGKTITTVNEEDQSGFDAVVTPDDQIAVVWVEDNHIKAQLIGSNGERLWGDNGIPVSNLVTTRQKDPRISYEDGVFYVGWSNMNDYNLPDFGDIQLFRIYAQKLINGQCMWDDGILVSQPDNGDEEFENMLVSINGRYFIWTTTWIANDNAGYINTYAKLLNPDGTTAAGWAEQGVATSTYFEIDTYQIYPQAILTTAGIFVAWLDLRMDYVPSIYGQLISSGGERLWDETGIPLGDTLIANEQYQFSLLGGNDITICWEEVVNNQYVLKVQKLSLSGLPQWGETGQFVASTTLDSPQVYPALARFSNGGMVISWQREDNIYPHDSDILYRYLNPDGTLMGAPEGSTLLVSPDEQRQPLIAVVGNEAYVSWIDSDQYYDPGRCGDGTHEFHGIYMQKISNEYVAIEDETLPVANMSLEQNYPNPFNPTTNISFSLKADSDITLTIYNLKGQQVKTLANGRLEKGRHSLIWNGTDDNDKPVSSGIFFYRLTEGKIQQTRKMVLLK